MSLGRSWLEVVEASTPWPAGVEGEAACSEAACSDPAWAAAGEVLGNTMGELFYMDLSSLVAHSSGSTHPTQPTHPRTIKRPSTLLLWAPHRGLLVHIMETTAIARPGPQVLHSSGSSRTGVSLTTQVFGTLCVSFLV
jgi:hypothetical protein